MSQLAGVFYFDSKPISRADKAAARRCFDRRHSAGIEVYESPGVLLMTSLGQLEPMFKSAAVAWRQRLFMGWAPR